MLQICFMWSKDYHTHAGNLKNDLYISKLAGIYELIMVLSTLHLGVYICIDI